jgi:hypothetical protein
MIRSTNQELGEYDLIRDPKHIAKVWAVIEAKLPAYWAEFIKSERKLGRGASRRLRSRSGR